ncbi:hypothetical protein LGH83_05190 [Lichenihabitans sp. PAMC28606]|nr:hypothetical protein [Lichenihabitans sp. PAMC28606]UDL95616.1 hypothetical protein LGH83_05190 [Lichenihabitans sp. PAMC28606]
MAQLTCPFTRFPTVAHPNIEIGLLVVVTIEVGLGRQSALSPFILFLAWP